MSAFTEMFSAKPSTESEAIATAAIDLIHGNASLVRICNRYKVKEKDVIRYIIEKTEYETKIDIERGATDIDPDNFGNK